MLKSVLFELQLRILALRYLILSKEILFLFDEACLLYFLNGVVRDPNHKFQCERREGTDLFQAKCARVLREDAPAFRT